MSHNTQSGWQPIETAPQDGKEVLLWDGQFYWLAFWREDHDGSGWDAGMTDRYGDNVLLEKIPTHWMRLPAAPSPPESPHV